MPQGDFYSSPVSAGSASRRMWSMAVSASSPAKVHVGCGRFGRLNGHGARRLSLSKPTPPLFERGGARRAEGLIMM